MSRQPKHDAVLQLLRVGDMEPVSRSLGVMAATLSSRRDTFLAARPVASKQLKNKRLKARLGELLLERELLEAKKTRHAGPSPRRRGNSKTGSEAAKPL